MIERIDNQQMDNQRMDNGRMENQQFENQQPESRQMDSKRMENQQPESRQMDSMRMENQQIEGRQIGSLFVDSNYLECAVEAILFVSGEPVKIARIAAVMGVKESDVEEAADGMRDKYSFERRGIRLVRLEDSLQLCSSPEFTDCIRRALETRKAPQMSQPALEVLSIIAYFQPATRAYVEQIRGVDSSYTIGVLTERNLIEPCGRLAAPGRPMLYRTTFTFLRTFGLESLRDLPELPHIEPDGDEREGIRNAITQLKEKETNSGERTGMNI